MDQQRREEIAKSYIEHIKIAVTIRDGSAPFRDFLDNWYAFSTPEADLLTKGGRPKWFNNPNILEIGHKLRKMHYISKSAMNIIQFAENNKYLYIEKRKSKDPSVRITVDHAVPISLIKKILFEKSVGITQKNITDFLINFYRLGVISIEENARLKDAKISATMPNNWDKCDPFARYRMADIPLFS